MRYLEICLMISLTSCLLGYLLKAYLKDLLQEINCMHKHRGHNNSNNNHSRIYKTKINNNKESKTTSLITK